ncbi:hypothetical protein [Vulgatibacter incomptus]|uniref:Uncharacterized protein n=1 Tax=Vulgatibacter incomptus TaxID=1391653 RepID=A0A0K1PFJ9_9BACT|nr:hypothetical protein [Vulgatibacter incomptus]AKU92290.1 hypothetical protein AKJ08_2677 [Vulgatibacter incomptus]
MVLVFVLFGAGCDINMGPNKRTNHLPEGTATVTNPPAPINGQAFHPTFVGWQFGGAFHCDPNRQAVTIAIWEGVTDPCTQIAPEGARVVFIETSAIDAGTFPVEVTCNAPRTAGAFFGIVQGNALFTQQAIDGSVALLGLNDENVLQGSFSVLFPNTISGTSVTSGSFNTAARCF